MINGTAMNNLPPARWLPKNALTTKNQPEPSIMRVHRTGRFGWGWLNPLKWCGDETGWMGHIEVSFPNIFHGGKIFIIWGLNASCLIVVWYFQQYQVKVTRFISFGWAFLFSQITGVGEQELLNQLLSWVTKFVSLRRRRDTHSRRCWIPSVFRPKEFREDIVDHFTRITELYQPSNTCDICTDLPWQVVMVRTASHPGNPQVTQTRAYWGLWRRGCVHEFCHLASSARGSVSSMAHQLQGSLVKPWWKLRWRRFMRETYRWTVKWFQNTTVACRLFKPSP